MANTLQHTRTRYPGLVNPNLVTPWWLSGGISAANCVVAYQPKGAANYAASKVNLANPGTYNAADAPHYPTWDAVNGWKNAGGATGDYLTIPYSAASGVYHSAIVRVSNVIPANGRVFDALGASDSFHIYPCFTDNKAYFRGYSSTGVAGAFTGSSGILCVVPGSGYINGAAVGSYSYAERAITSLQLFRASGMATTIPIYLQAFALYTGILTAAQVAALTAAMAAL